jgi:hypothetical protein
MPFKRQTGSECASGQTDAAIASSFLPNMQVKNAHHRGENGFSAPTIDELLYRCVNCGHETSLRVNRPGG